MKCIRCQKQFELSDGDERQRQHRAEYGKRYFSPRRCTTCRWERRQPADCPKCGRQHRLSDIEDGRCDDPEVVEMRKVFRTTEGGM